MPLSPDKPSAFLVMYKPQQKSIPDDIMQLLVGAKDLGKPEVYLVSSVVFCPAFVLQISAQRTPCYFGGCGSTFSTHHYVEAETTRVKFSGFSDGWQNENTGSWYQEGCDREGQYAYTPLFKLRGLGHGNA